MDQRKRLILKEIVDRYIKYGRPVSSQTLLEEYGLSVSSATIRNDMKYLEKHGYISKAYSSAGRVPTQKAYRFFVDWLLELSELTRREQHQLIESYAFRRPEMSELLRQAAFLLAQLSGLLGFVLAPKLEETKLEYISLIKIDPEHAVVVMISDLGTIESRVIRAKVIADELSEINELLNRRFIGRRLSEIGREIERLTAAEDWQEALMRDAFSLLSEFVATSSRRRLYVEGMLNLIKTTLDQFGYEKAQKLMALLEDEAGFEQSLERAGEAEDLYCLIGKENPIRELRDYSLVAMPYGYSGILGVLGPTRMDYSKACSATKYIGSRLKTILHSQV